MPLNKASAAFESTLNREARRKGGMHYTSIENIHMVIDMLFLNDLKGEFGGIKGQSNAGRIGICEGSTA